MWIFQVVTDLNSFPPLRMNFEKQPILCKYSCTENQSKRPTLVADLTNFPFEFFHAVFAQDSSPPFLYRDAKKKMSRTAKKSNQGGGGGGYCQSRPMVALKTVTILIMTFLSFTCFHLHTCIGSLGELGILQQVHGVRLNG